MNSIFRFNTFKINCFTIKFSFYVALFSCLVSTVYAGGGGPISCNPTNYFKRGLANGGRPITQFNGYDKWDSMLEILNADGRQERFWLDDNGDGSGKIRHTSATTPCTGFAWVAHSDFDGYAKEMVLARDSKGRLIVAHIGRDNAFYWRSQFSPGGLWVNWKRLEPTSGFSGLGAQMFDGRPVVFTASDNSEEYEIALILYNSISVACKKGKLRVTPSSDYATCIP